MRRLASIRAVVLILACGGLPEPAPASTPAPTSTPTLSPAAAPAPPVVPKSRRCGEAGDAPTVLPPLLAGGRALVGTGVVVPGGSLKIGTVDLRYDASTWIGTMRAGHHAPGLHVLLDRAEVDEHAPYGALEELRPDSLRTLEVSPYRLQLRVGAGDPPADVAVSVTREVCPRTGTLAPAATPRWLWLSTEGIRWYTRDTGSLLQIGLDLRDQQPWLTVRDSGYQQGLALRPGVPAQIRAGASTLVVERVEMGAGTRYDGRWHAEGEPRAHVLVRLESGPTASFPAAAPASTICGEASPTRSEPPEALTAAPKIAERRRLQPGQHAAFGPLTLDYGSFEIPAHGGGPYREEAQTIPNLQVLGPNRGGTSLTHFLGEPRLLRIDTALLRVTADGDKGAIRAERLALRCAAEQVMPPQVDPFYLWLGTLGHTYVRVGDFDVKALNLQVYPDAVKPSINFSSEHGSLMRTLGPELVGRGFTLDAHLVEIVDVQVGAAGTDGFGPAARVQVRVSN